MPRRSRIVIAASLGVAIGLGVLTGLAFEPKRLTLGDGGVRPPERVHFQLIVARKSP